MVLPLICCVMLVSTGGFARRSVRIIFTTFGTHLIAIGMAAVKIRIDVMGSSVDHDSGLE